MSIRMIVAAAVLSAGVTAGAGTAFAFPNATLSAPTFVDTAAVVVVKKPAVVVLKRRPPIVTKRIIVR